MEKNKRTQEGEGLLKHKKSIIKLENNILNVLPVFAADDTKCRVEKNTYYKNDHSLGTSMHE